MHLASSLSGQATPQVSGGVEAMRVSSPLHNSEGALAAEGPFADLLGEGIEKEPQGLPLLSAPLPITDPIDDFTNPISAQSGNEQPIVPPNGHASGPSGNSLPKEGKSTPDDGRIMQVISQADQRPMPDRPAAPVTPSLETQPVEPAGILTTKPSAHQSEMRAAVPTSQAPLEAILKQSSLNAQTGSQSSNDQHNSPQQQKLPSAQPTYQDSFAQTGSQFAATSAPSLAAVQSNSASPMVPAQPVTALLQAQPAAADPSVTIRDAQPLERLVETITQMRESGQSVRGELTLRHGEFGMVAMRVSSTDGELHARLASRDPAFVAAAQSALTDRPVAASNETAQTSSRQQDGGHHLGQNGAHDQGRSTHNAQSDSTATKGEHGAAVSSTDDHSQRKDVSAIQSASGLFA